MATKGTVFKSRKKNSKVLKAVENQAKSGWGSRIFRADSGALNEWQWIFEKSQLGCLIKKSSR